MPTRRSSRRWARSSRRARATRRRPEHHVGFQPKAVIFFWTSQHALTAGSFGFGAIVGYGFATAAGSERAVNFGSDDSFTPDNAGRWQWINRCISIAPDAQLAPTAYASLSSMNADGFTVDWTRDSFGWIVHYMAIGGADVTNATIGSFTPTAGTGSQSVTGLTFQPDFMMFLSIDSNTIDARVAHGKVSLGYAGRAYAYGITQGATTAVSRAGVLPALTSGGQLATAAIMEKDEIIAAGSPTFTATVTSLDVNGFTLNKTVNTGGTETTVHYLALEGGQYRVGAIARPAAAGAQTLPYTGVGFSPRGSLPRGTWYRPSMTRRADLVRRRGRKLSGVPSARTSVRRSSTTRWTTRPTTT
jgi:hypothetical protein